MKRKSKSHERKKTELPNPHLCEKFPPNEGLSPHAYGTMHPIVKKGKVGPFIKELEESFNLNPVIATAVMLDDPSLTVRKNAAKLLKSAIAQGLDINMAIPGIVEALDFSDGIGKQDKRDFLAYLATGKRTRDCALPSLLSYLSSGEESFKHALLGILDDLYWNGNESDRIFVISKIVEFTRSDWFVNETKKNSPGFVNATEAIAGLFDILRFREDKK